MKKIMLWWAMSYLIAIMLMTSAKPAERYWEVKVRVYQPTGRYNLYTYNINANDSYTAKRRARELAMRLIKFEVVSYKEIRQRP